MKKNNIILAAAFLFSAVTLLQPLSAQEKTKEEKDKELKIQEAIDQQKKAMVEEKKAHEELQNALEMNKTEIDNAIQEAKSHAQNRGNFGGEARAFSGRGTRPNSFFENYFDPLSSTGFDGQFSGERGRSTWDFSKSVKESTFSRDYIFDVDKTSKSVVMSITGECKSGDIQIRIIMPNGKMYSDVLIDESGNLNWRKSFNISEEENKDKSGEWKYVISTSNATGYFKISLQTF